MASTEEIMTAQAEKLDGPIEAPGEAMPEAAPVSEASTAAPEAESSAVSEVLAKVGTNGTAAAAPPVEAAPDLEPIIAPASLTAEEKEAWKKLPRDAQAYVARRERERDQGIQQRLSELKHYQRQLEPIQKALEPHVNYLQRMGIPPDLAINRMMAWHQMMQQNPQEGAKQFLEAYGVQWPGAQNGNGGQEPGQQQPVSSIPPELTQQIQEMRGILSDYQLKQAQSAIKAAESDVEGWKSAKDDKGNPLRPYVRELEEEMQPVVRALKQTYPDAPNAQILQKAYTVVLADHPEIQESIDKKREAAAKAASIAANNAQAKQAKRAAVTVKGSAGAEARAVPKKTADVMTALMEGNLEARR